MKLIDIIAISWQNLTANKMRSFLTIMGIGVGIGTIIFLVSLGYGLQELSIKKITSISSLTALDVTPAQGSVELNKKTLDDFAINQNVESVSPLLSLTGQVDFSQRKADIVGYAVKKDYFTLQGLKVGSGKSFETDNQVVISTGVAKALDVPSVDLLDHEIDFTGFFQSSSGSGSDRKEHKYTVSGVIEDEASAFVYVPLVDEFITDATTFNSTKVKVNDQVNLAEVRSSIESKGFKVTSIADTINQVYQVFSIVQIVLASFGIIALFVASIGMFNTMTIALLERTRDIGIMKSIGVQNGTVRKMFLIESLLISFFGGISGTALGILIGYLINTVINAMAVSFGGSAEKLFSTPVPIVLLIVGFSIIVGIATGIYPAKRAAKLNPLDALRYE